MNVKGGLMQGVRRGDWKAIRKTASSALQLYDLANDVGESNDVAARYPKVVRELGALMTAAHRPPREQAEPSMPAGRKYR